MVVASLALLPLVASGPAQAANPVCTVTSSDDSGDGSLRACVTMTNATGGDIVFQEGLSGTILLASGLLLSNDVAVLGPGADMLTIQAAPPGFRVFDVTSGVTATISGLTITGGGGDYGGAIRNEGTLTVTGSTLSGNSAVNGGGGIANYGALTVTGSTLTGNTVEGGGGGAITSWGTMTVTNSTIAGNAADVGGGGILASSDLTVTNSTIAGNFGGGSIGGGIGISGTPTVVLRNALVAGNSAAYGNDLYGPVDVASSFNNLIGVQDSGGNVDGALVDGVNGNQVGVTEPGLGPPADNGGPTQTMTLLPGSPAIDAASATYAPETDQRGVARDRAPDIGAFEAGPQPDLLISRLAGSGYVGDDVYSTTGAGQTKRLSARRTQTRTFYVRVVNDGAVRTRFALRGSAPAARSRVRYFKGTVEITTPMRSKAGWPVTLRAGAAKTIEMRITVRRSAAFGSRMPGTVTATWPGEHSRADLVRGIVKVVR